MLSQQGRARTDPPKPALVYDVHAGRAIDVEVYELSAAEFESFVSEVAAPLAIGSLILEDGQSVKGFVAEPRAIIGAEEITDFKGWRPWLKRHNKNSK